jgi:hypothetical protein
MKSFNPGNNLTSSFEILESKHRVYDLLDEPMVLLKSEKI